MNIFRRHFEKNHKEAANKGSAMVVVIIAMAFIGILASVLMYMSLLNYQMKANNLKAKDNFYSAETVLDEIRMGMEGQISTSVSGAYTKVLESFESTSEEQKNSKMRYYFLSSMQEYYKADDTTVYDLTKLYNYISADTALAQNTVLEAVRGTDTYRVYQDASGNLIQEKEGDPTWSGIPKGDLKLYTDGLSFCNLKVTYTDDAGYVSVIQTDLRVKLPDMEFAQAVTLPSITGISMVAQNNIQVIPDAPMNLSNNTIGGSFYADRLIIGSEEADTENGTGVTVNLQETAGNENADKRMVVAKDLYLGRGATLTSDQYGELWAGTIRMHGGGNNTASVGKIDFAGNSIYVAGDLRMDGQRNNFKAGTLIDGEYTGQYIGFGTGRNNADNSAMIVNGTDTEIYLNELRNLTLAGNSYISLNTAKSGLSGEDAALNTGVKDIMMGQSIAVKSDQLAYLIPAQCIALDASGKSVLGGSSNPVTKEQYYDLIWDQSNKKVRDGVREVVFDVPCAALNGNTLASYGLNSSNVQKYFKRINSKITLVYYYVAFDSTTEEGRTNAARYYQDYYSVNKETMDAYASLYTKAVKVREASSGAYIMHLSGNLVCSEEHSAELHPSTLGTDKNNVGYQALLTADQSKFKALSKKMIDSYEQLLPSETADTANAYTNLVNEGKILTYWGVVRADTNIVDKSGAKYFTGADPEYKAVVVQGDYEYTSAENFRGLIIATGNVKVSSNFHGTILAGGNITLGQNVNVEPDRDAVLHVMTYSNKAGTTETEYSVAQFLKGGEGYLHSDGKAYINSDIKLGELIVYENWQKK